MASMRRLISISDDIVNCVTSFLEQPHCDRGNVTIMSTIYRIVTEELWGGYRVEMSSLDPNFVMSHENSSINGFEIVHDEQDVELFKNASYKVPLITIAPGEREHDWACPVELAHGLQVEHMLRCVSVMRVGRDSRAWWERHLSPPLRPEVGEYVAFMFVLGREGEEKRKYLFPPLKVLEHHTAPTGEHNWVGLDVPQHRDFATLRAEMAKYEKQYNDPVEDSISEKIHEDAYEKAHREDLIFRVESWLENLSIENNQEVGRCRGRRGGRGGRDRNLYDPEEKPQTHERKVNQRDSKTAAGSRLRQTAGRQILKRNTTSPEKPVVRQILKRQVNT